MVWLTLVLLSIATLLFIWWYLQRVSRRQTYALPPGPGLLGFFAGIGFDYEHCFHKLGKKYGKKGLFSFPNGLMERAVLLNDWPAIKEAFVHQSQVFSGRPPMFCFNQVVDRTDIITSDGPLWKERRRCSLRLLRDLGFGKTSIESIILDEVQKICYRLAACEGQETPVNDLFFLPILNIIWRTVAAKSYAYDDQYILNFKRIIRKMVEKMIECALVDVFPVLRFAPGSGYWEFLEYKKKVTMFLEDEVEEHIRTYEEGVVRDFTDAFLAEMERNKEDLATTKVHLIGILFDFFLGGTSAIDHTLLWGILYAATWPEIQDKLQQELDSVIGQCRYPSYNDRHLLPYTEAFIMEVHRFATILPLGVAHCTTKDTNLLGYDLPKGTKVLANFYAINHNPDYWDDPQVFRPERFLGDDSRVQKPEWLIPFSVGARQCLGESLARMELFLIFATLLQRFSFRYVTGEEPPNLKPASPINRQPQDFVLTIRKRF